MRDTKHLEKHSNKLAESKKEKALFRQIFFSKSRRAGKLRVGHFDVRCFKSEFVTQQPPLATIDIYIYIYMSSLES